MSLFSSDIIEKEVHTALKTRFAIDLMDLIYEKHQDLIDAQRVRGQEGVLFLLHLYILNIKNKTNVFDHTRKYENLRIEPKISIHPTNGWVSCLKGEYYITIPTDGYPMTHITHITRDNITSPKLWLEPEYTGPANWEEYGEIIISLDKYLKIKYYKVCDYEHHWI